MTIIQGHVVDPKNRPISNASVFLVSSPVSMPDVAQLTDSQGDFLLAVPVPGTYIIGVRSDNWGAIATEVQISGQENGTVQVLFNFHGT